MKHYILKYSNKKLFIIFLVLISINYSFAQEMDLYRYLEKDFNIGNTRSSINNLTRYINGTKNAKKQKANELQINAHLIANYSNSAYVQADKVLEKLKSVSTSFKTKYKLELIKKMKILKSDIYKINYRSKALIMYCQWMIDKPKNHGGKTLNDMIDTFNDIIKFKNEIAKKRIVLNNISNFIVTSSLD